MNAVVKQELFEAQAEPISVDHEARKALDAANGDVVKAVTILERKARSEPLIANALVMPLLKTACYDAIRAVCRHDRRKVWTSPNYSAGGNGERVHQLASSLMDFPLPGGKKLAQATRDDLQEAGKFYGMQADNMAHKARWLLAIADRLEGRKMVKSCLSESDLVSLKESV
jgi:hypothetical protein